MTDTIQIVAAVVSVIVLLAGFYFFIEYMNTRGARKRGTDITKRQNMTYQTTAVSNCNSCPCFSDWCRPVCGLNYTIQFTAPCDYIKHAVHPKCPLRHARYTLFHKPPDPGSDTVVIKK